MITFGLPRESLEARKGSIGASDARIICNGTDEDVFTLWQIKIGKIESPNLDSNIYAQLGQFIEPFTQTWFENRTGVAVEMRGDEIRNPDYPGLHVTLDGFVYELPPVDFTQTSDFKFSWGCHKPRLPVEAVFEMKFREGMQFKAEEQVKTFLPQLHQGMVITRTSFAILCTIVTGPLRVVAHVVPFDPYYWGECFARISDFQEAVRDKREPIAFPPIKTSKVQGVQPVRTVLKNVDMSTTRHANEWALHAHALKLSLPSADENRRAKREKAAKEGLKALIDADVGTARGFGVTAKRNNAGSISFEVDAEDAQATAAASYQGAA